MSDTLYVNADWSALVPAGSPEARYGIARVDAVRRGLLKPGADEAPVEEPVVMHSANEPAPEPEAKEVPKPADKAVRKPRTK